MPIFEYQCNQCGHVTSFLEKVDSQDSHLCENCGSNDTKKIFSTFAVDGGTHQDSGGSSCPTGTCPLSGN